MSLLEVRDLSVHFGPRQVVDKVSFSLDAGEKLALVGESASGKTVSALSTFGVLVVTLLLLILIGDALRDALDPRKVLMGDEA